MKILIVEDDNNKLADIKSYLIEILENYQVEFVERKSFQSGLVTALEENFFLLILDMSIPNFDITELDDGGDTLYNGGELIMMELNRENIHHKSIILTQYETIGNISLAKVDENLQLTCKEMYLGWIFYSVVEDSWKNKLKQTIDSIL